MTRVTVDRDAMVPEATARLLYGFLLICTLPVLASCGGGGGNHGTDNAVDATVSPAESIVGYTGETRTVVLTFTTSDGEAASALSIGGLDSLPAGWTKSAGSSTCGSVAAGSGCALTLAYSPLVKGSGTVTLAFNYQANDGTAKSGAVHIPFTARTVTLQLLEGALGGGGNLDGIGSAARFNGPTSTATDSAGNVYVSDGNGLIRKITPDRTVTTILGSSSGVLATEGILQFGGIAIDAADNLYIADTDDSIILKRTPDGVLTTLAGSVGNTGAADGTGAAATFAYPEAVALDAAGMVYVADRVNNEIRQITPQGVVTTLAGSPQAGSADGTGAAAGFSSPSGIAVNAAGTVYVADSNNNTIRQITPQGVVSTLAGIVGDFAWADGTGTAAAFSLPGSMSIDSTGSLYVADEGGLIIRKITAQGVVTTPVGTPDMAGSADGTGAAARFQGAGLSVGAGDVLYVADTGNNTIRMISTQDVVTTIAGLASPFLAAQSPGIAADAAGDVYVLRSDGLLKISPQSVITALPLQTSEFVSGAGVAVGGDGTIYVSEVSIVRKISPQGVVTTLAGSPGLLGSADGTGSAARFNMTAGIAVNTAGTVYVVDSENDTIRTITPNGVVSTLAGTAGPCCGDSVDGSGSSAHFDGPFSLTLDTGGNLYVGEGQGKIRKVTPQGVVTTLPLASGGLSFNGGTGSSNLSIDGSGNLYVADEYNQVIRMISPQGAVTTIIG